MERWSGGRSGNRRRNCTVRSPSSAKKFPGALFIAVNQRNSPTGGEIPAKDLLGLLWWRQYTALLTLPSHPTHTSDGRDEHLGWKAILSFRLTHHWYSSWNECRTVVPHLLLSLTRRRECHLRHTIWRSTTGRRRWWVDQSKDALVLGDGWRRRVCACGQELADYFSLGSVDGGKHGSQASLWVCVRSRDAVAVGQLTGGFVNSMRLR